MEFSKLSTSVVPRMSEKLGRGKRSPIAYEMYVHVLNSAYFRNYVRCMDVSSVRIFVSFFLLLRGWYRKGGMEGGKDGRKDGLTMSERNSTIPQFPNSIIP